MAYDRMRTVLTVEDTFGRRKNKTVDLKTTDAAQGEIDGGTVVTTYANVMEGVIRKATIAGDLTWATVVPAGVNIDTGCTASCQLAGRPEKAALKWPTPLPSLFLPDGTLNVSDAAVVALSAIYEAAGIATLSDGESITGILSGSLDK